MKNFYLRVNGPHPLLRGMENAQRTVNGAWRIPVRSDVDFNAKPLFFVAPYPDLPMEEVYLDVAVWRQKGSMTFHLVNLTNPMMMKGPFRELLPVGEQRIRVQLPPNAKVKRCASSRWGSSRVSRLAAGG